MTNNDHNRLMEVAQNSLLHLYMKALSNGRFLPTNQRNETLVKFLKAKLKQPRYKTIKRELKHLIIFGRTKDKDLEIKIRELNAITPTTTKKNNDLKNFHELLSQLEADHEFPCQLLDESQTREAETVYVLKEHIEHGFKDTGQQIAPLSLLVKSKRCTDLVAAITAIGSFEPELTEFNESTYSAHVVLHPLEQNGHAPDVKI